MKKALENIRPIPVTNKKREIAYALFAALLGLVLGYIAKATDSSSILGEIGTGLGIWVFLATLLGAFSNTPLLAMLHVPLFFLSMLFSYYLYGHLVLSFFPRAYFIGWLLLTLLSPLGGLLVWLARGKGLPANICAALPVSLLLAMGYPAFYTLQTASMLDLLFAVFLLAILQKTWKDRAIALSLSVVFAFVIDHFYLLTYLP